MKVSTGPVSASAPLKAKKLCRCIKQVRKTVKVKPNTFQERERAAIGICVRSVIQGKNRKRTIKKFSCGSRPKLITKEYRS
jgi:pyrroline-5-carboxylate reductase